MWRKLKNWRWAILIAAFLVAGLIYSYWPQPDAVDLGTVTEGPMAVGVTDDGVTRVRDLYTVTAPVTGYVTRIELDPGDEVVAGQTVIARMAGIPSQPLDQRSRNEIGNAVAASRAVENAAQAGLRLAEADLGRAEELAKRGFLSRAELDARRTSAARQRADLARSRAETRRLQSQLTEPAAVGTPSGGVVAVRSPTSGIVLRRLSESEGVVPQGMALIEIGDPARIEVVADLLSREAARIRPGNVVEITRWGGENTLPGRVRTVEPFGLRKISALGIEEQRVNVIIDFSPEAARQIARLGHGYQVDATVILWSAKSALRVPVGALFRGPEGGWQALVVEGGRAALHDVKIGRLNEDYGEVLGGLAKGAMVILNPSGAIADGSRVRERE
ncbi:efflux RND transporter periplasmic adaptor subunit [Qipengyuania sp. CAU 1752]